MNTQTRRSTLRWAPEYVVTAERAGNSLLVMVSVLLVIAFCLPWWQLKVVADHSPVLNQDAYGFSGWGKLSLAAALVAVVLTAGALVARGKSPVPRLGNRTLAWVTVATGLTELFGNLLCIIVAPKTKVFLGGSRFANVGVGLTVAIVAGVVLVASGVLMLVSRNRQAPASDGQGAAPELVG
jgi:hypothetical protein